MNSHADEGLTNQAVVDKKIKATRELREGVRRANAARGLAGTHPRNQQAGRKEADGPQVPTDPMAWGILPEDKRRTAGTMGRQPREPETKRRSVTDRLQEQEKNAPPGKTRSPHSNYRTSATPTQHAPRGTPLRQAPTRRGPAPKRNRPGTTNQMWDQVGKKPANLWRSPVAKAVIIGALAAVVYRLIMTAAGM